MKFLGVVGIENSDRYKFAHDIKSNICVIAFNNNNQLMVLNDQRYNYHYLPRVSFDTNLTKKHEMKKHLYDSMGVQMELVNEIGVVIEFYYRFAQSQISYCYQARVNHVVENKLQDDNLIIKWLDLKSTITLLKSDKPINYTGRVKKESDLLLLNEALKKLLYF